MYPTSSGRSACLGSWGLLKCPSPLGGCGTPWAWEALKLCHMAPWKRRLSGAEVLGGPGVSQREAFTLYSLGSRGHCTVTSRGGTAECRSHSPGQSACWDPSPGPCPWF